MRNLLRRWRHRVLRVTCVQERQWSPRVHISRAHRHYIYWRPSPSSLLRLASCLNARRGHIALGRHRWHWSPWYRDPSRLAPYPLKERNSDH